MMQSSFPKNIGIVFLEQKDEGLEEGRRYVRKGSRLHLGFRKLACAHLLLQMNRVQNLFNYSVIEAPDFVDSVSLSRRKFAVQWYESGQSRCFQYSEEPGLYIVKWFDKEIIGKLEDEYIERQFVNENLQNSLSVDYYIGITSEYIGDNFFLRTRERRESDFNRIFSIITTYIWEKRRRRRIYYSPPSVFEYIATSVFICSIRALVLDLMNKFVGHKDTRGCIFDHTGTKAYRRILVSNPNICAYCEQDMRELEVIIRKGISSGISVCESINNVISREWMGSNEKWGSPIYNLKRNYKYDIDRNSGFYKTLGEQFRDSLREKSPEWIVGGLVGLGLGLLLAVLKLQFHIP